MYFYNDYYSPFHFFLGPVFMIIIWGLVIWGIVSIVRYFSNHSTNKNESALEILKERYAKGEITREQFELMKKDIK